MPSTALCNQLFRGINSVANFNWQYILYRNIPVSPGGDNSIKWRLILPDESIFKLRSLKPGFHMIVRIVRIVPVVSKNFDTIGTTETIAGFHMIVSIPSNTEDARSSAIFLGPTTEFWRDIRKRNGGHQSQSKSPGLLTSYSFDFAP